MVTDKGIVLLMGGDPLYVKLTFNLSSMIKRSLGSYPITVLYDDESILYTMYKNYPSLIVESLIDSFVKIPKEYLYLDNSGIKHFGLTKVNAYKLSPYKKTIFLDVDSAIFGHADVFSCITDINLPLMFQCDYYSTAINAIENEYNIIVWAKFPELFSNKDVRKFIAVDIAGTGIFQLKSFFFYFEKNDDSKKYFEFADLSYRFLYENHKKLNLKTWINGTIPDELAFFMSLLSNEKMTELFKKQFVREPTTNVVTDVFTPMYVLYNKEIEYVVQLMMMHGSDPKYMGMTMPGKLTQSGISFYNKIAIMSQMYSCIDVKKITLSEEDALNKPGEWNV